MIPFDEASGLGSPRLLSRKDLIRVMLRLQFEGWKRALEADAALTREQHETYMNGRLYQGMVAVRASLNLTNIFIVEKPGVRPEGEAAQPEREPDVIVFFAEFGANEPHAVLECKRLDPFERPKSLRGEYVRSGMDRFVSGAYGGGHNIDFMAAYVLRGEGSQAMHDVNGYLQNVGRVNDRLCATEDAKGLGFVAQSDHIRVLDHLEFRVLHSFLPFGTK